MRCRATRADVWASAMRANPTVPSGKRPTVSPSVAPSFSPRSCLRATGIQEPTVNSNRMIPPPGAGRLTEPGGVLAGEGCTSKLQRVVKGWSSAWTRFPFTNGGTMKRLAFLALAFLSSTACGGGAYEVSAPAPPNALSCALRVAVEANYEPTEGGVADGFMRLWRNRALTAGDVGRETAARVLSFGLAGSSRAEWDVLRIVGAGGQLNVSAWSLSNKDKAEGPTEDGQADADAILAKCGEPVT